MFDFRRFLIDNWETPTGLREFLKAAGHLDRQLQPLDGAGASDQEKGALKADVKATKLHGNNLSQAFLAAAWWASAAWM